MVMEEQVGSSGLASESIPVPRVQEAMLDEAKADGDKEKQTARGKSRHRKKALHALIVKQMEFYFSDANLSKDRFLANLISTDPYVDMDIFLRCNRIRTLTQDKERIAKALKSSKLLALSEDGQKVRRITPINSREEADACTIYVQDLPADADHDWLINIFSRYGSVAYVSLPKYKSNRKLKGFAFVEFETVDGAEKCLKEFEEKGCTLPSHTAPEELLSITTFSEDDPPPNDLDNDKLGSQPIAQEIKSLKRRAPSEVAKPVKKARCTSNSDNEKNDSDECSESNQDNTDEEEGKDNDGDKKKKKKRKRKRKGKVEQADIFDYGIHILAKRDWKKLRNKYLQLQRSKMKQLKQHLRKTRWGSHEKREKIDMEEPMNHEPPSEQKNSTPKFTFAEGLIIKIELDEPCCNPKTFKQQFKSDSGVEYIDVKEGTSSVYVRCNNVEAADNFAKKYSEEKTVAILEGDEEKAYWKKMMQDREEKFDKKNRTKQRGREKLLKKAEKELGKHIRFDEV